EGYLEGATLDFVGQLVALRVVRGGEPSYAQPLDCLVARPAGQGPVSAWSPQIAVGCRVQQVIGGIGGAEHIPAALADRFLDVDPFDGGAPFAGRQFDIEAELL